MGLVDWNLDIKKLFVGVQVVVNVTKRVALVYVHVLNAMNIHSLSLIIGLKMKILEWNFGVVV
jgi:hypothetical protein